MNLEDLVATNNIRIRNHDLSVKTTRTKQCRIKNVRTVGGCDQNDRFIGFKPIHFNQQLVEGLLTFIIATAKSGTTMPTHGVNFVDKDDARRILLSLFEHVADAACTHTDEHFNKGRTGNGEERHIRFTRNRTSEQSLTCSGRSDEQYTTRNFTAKSLEFLRIAQKFDNFFQIDRKSVV